MKLALVFNVRNEANIAKYGQGMPADYLAEWDAPETVEAVRAALATGHDVIPIEADESAFEALRAAKPDLVFNVAEGLFGPGREAQIPSICEMLQIPYTGSDGTTLGICLQKDLARMVLDGQNVPVPEQAVVRPGEFCPKISSWPRIVKPQCEGSSKGISDDCLVDNQDDLARKVKQIHEDYEQSALVEEFLPGREFTLALLGNEDTLRALPPVEICFDSLPDTANPIYSYEAKWVWDTPDQPLEIFACPPSLTDAELNAIAEVGKAAFRATRCRDWCRIDIRMDNEGNPHIIELNPLPGILPNPEENSCFPKAARAAGLSYEQLLLTVVDEAARRLHIPQPTKAS